MALETQISLQKQRKKFSLVDKVDIKGAQQWSAECDLEILGNLPDEPLEWELPYEQLSALLVLADLTAKSHMRLKIFSFESTSTKYHKLSFTHRRATVPGR
jgi:hypothetical protein